MDTITHALFAGLSAKIITSHQTETVYRLHYNSHDEMVLALYGFERYFNLHRPYKAMDAKTPEELT